MMVLKLANGLRVERARAPLVEELRKGAEWRANKLTASEYDETTWSARTFMAFTTPGAYRAFLVGLPC